MIQIHHFATAFGMDEEKLRDMMSLGLTEANINEFGRFDELRKSVDKEKAKKFLGHLLCSIFDYGNIKI